MKISNLILTLILALVVSFSLHSQSNSSRSVNVDNDKESIYIEYEEGEVVLLKIDGVVIDKSDYSDYKHIFKKYKYQSKSNHHTPANDSHDRKDMQSILLENLKAYLSGDENFSEANFKFKLTKKYMKVNGKKLSNDQLSDCLEIFDETAGYPLTKGSYFKVNISPGSKSVSLSIED